MRLFRQTELGNWPAVFVRMAGEVRKLLPPSGRSRPLRTAIAPAECCTNRPELYQQQGHSYGVAQAEERIARIQTSLE
jgi:hypothetical protein